jgi:hypothetical protein
MKNSCNNEKTFTVLELFKIIHTIDLRLFFCQKSRLYEELMKIRTIAQKRSHFHLRRNKIDERYSKRFNKPLKSHNNSKTSVRNLLFISLKM